MPNRRLHGEHPVDQLPADAADEFLLSVAETANPRPAGKVLPRTAGDEIDRPGIGVSAVKRALRSLDDFHPLEIRHVQRLDVAGVIHAVDEIGDAAFHAELHPGENIALAADYRPFGRAAEGAGEAQPRREARDIGDAVDVELLDRRGGERRD